MIFGVSGWHFQMRQVGDDKRAKSWSQWVHFVIEMKNINMMMLQCEVIVFRIYIYICIYTYIYTVDEMLYYLSIWIWWICFWYPIYLIYLYTVVNIFVHNIHTDILDSHLLLFYLGEFFEGMIEPTAARWPVLGFKCVLFLMMRTAMLPCEVGYPSKWSIELQHERHDIPY